MNTSCLKLVVEKVKFRRKIQETCLRWSNGIGSRVFSEEIEYFDRTIRMVSDYSQPWCILYF